MASGLIRRGKGTGQPETTTAGCMAEMQMSVASQICRPRAGDRVMSLGYAVN